MKIALAIAVGLLTGIISGFGIGGGSLLIVYLTAFAAVDQYTAGGINLLYFLCCAPAALVSHIKNRRVEWKAVLRCTLAGVVTCAFSAWLSGAIHTDLLRRLFGGLLLYIGVRELRIKPQKNASHKP